MFSAILTYKAFIFLCQSRRPWLPRGGPRRHRAQADPLPPGRMLRISREEGISEEEEAEVRSLSFEYLQNIASVLIKNES